jgi:hypothetical protein
LCFFFLSAEDAQIAFCTLERGEIITTLTFDKCISTDGTFDTNVDVEEGLFTAPQDGYYVISFSGHLRSSEGTRIWMKLNKKDATTKKGTHAR